MRPLICRLLGLSIDENELAKVLKKARVKLKPGYQYSAAEMHGALVDTCINNSLVSKYVDKMLRERFEPYRIKIGGLDPKDICELIEGGNEFQDVPLPSLIWFALRNQHEEINEIEVRIFNAVHMQEHRALKFYDALSKILPDGKPENVMEQLKETLISNDKLQERYKRSEQKRELLKADIEVIKRDKANLTLALVEQKKLNERLRNDLERLGGESALEQIESLNKEKTILAQEIKSLIQELLTRESERVIKSTELMTEFRASIEDESLPSHGVMEKLPVTLNGRKVAFVGGFHSLIPHYQQVVECLGGTFCFHSWKSPHGDEEIESVVDKSDVVFCPRDKNSHRACRCVRKVCKLTGKREKIKEVSEYG
jgi:hypothetical protein